MIRVVLADDHAVVRAGLVQLLATVADIEVAGIASDGAEAAALVGDADPDVVLLDLFMPGVDGVEATRRIMRTHPRIAIVMLTSFSERDMVLAAVDAGAVGYLLKDAEPEELLRGIRAAARGESPMSPKAVQSLLSARAERQGIELTARERDVLVAVAEGLANKQVARKLGISEKTVKAHLSSVFHRLGVSDRTQAVLWARQHGLLGVASL